MTPKKSSLLFLFFLCGSCSIFVDQFEKDLFEKNNISPVVKTSETICLKNKTSSIITENKWLKDSFSDFIEVIPRNYRIGFPEKIVLLSLLQMNLRPDLSSPNAKLQYVLKYKGKTYYLNTYSDKDKSFAYLHGLNKVLTQTKSKYSLRELGKMIDQYYSDPFFVSHDFETFLNDNREKILENDYLRQIYSRGDETLRKNERVPKLSLTKIINHYNRSPKKHILVNNFLFELDKPEFQTIPKCNFDMGLYQDSIFLINQETIKSNIFGLKENKNSFLATSSMKLNGLQTIPGTFLFSGSSNTRGASICLYNPKSKSKKQQTLWLISSNSRDPGQHLFHLLQYGIDKIENLEELNSMLKFSRHLFLKEPVRLIIESRKSSKSQLSELLKLNVPIYNAKSLGRIWGFWAEKGKSTFLLDERKHGHLSCK